MPVAAHPMVVEASLDDASYSEIDGVKDISFAPSRANLETTDFKDTTAARTRILGLKDGSFSLSGDYESGDSTGQQRMITAHGNGADCFIRCKFDPSAAGGLQGFKVKCKIESYDISATFDSTVKMSFSCSFTDAPVAV